VLENRNLRKMKRRGEIWQILPPLSKPTSARQHDLAWELTDREFQDLNQPHRNNDFCDDE
jgi:hypothetical protein